jgi:hypothetical protein
MPKRLLNVELRIITADLLMDAIILCRMVCTVSCVFAVIQSKFLVP